MEIISNVFITYATTKLEKKTHCALYNYKPKSETRGHSQRWSGALNALPLFSLVINTRANAGNNNEVERSAMLSTSSSHSSNPL
jgi:hypothetical protein